MPKRTDLKKILILGSGPIRIGQACEFDYSGTQAVKALKEEGYEVILINSNPATIMTDPELADRVYIEPLTVESAKRIIEIEKPDAILPTMGGQTALNLTLDLFHAGILAANKVEILGADPDVIDKAEDRARFKETMTSIGIESARSQVVRSKEEGEAFLKEVGLPIILRPSFTLGGEGGGIATTKAEFFEKLEVGLFLSPSNQVLIEESLLGWKEFELEVVRDRNDNVIIVCSIENFDPMGVHTGDSITVAPAQTLTDKEYQKLRDDALKIIRAIGVETGGSNIQFAVNPKDGRSIVIEMNPRVSRSSALASKATGFPIARVAAKLAVGFTLDELKNDITKTTPASFEPAIDYVVVKVPRFDFKKFEPTPPILSTQMKSVGEVMAMGRTFEEALGKALVGLEVKAPWLKPTGLDEATLLKRVQDPYEDRIRSVADLLRQGKTADALSEISKGIDPWFLSRIQKQLSLESLIKSDVLWEPNNLLTVKKAGWTDRALSEFLSIPEAEVRKRREEVGVHAAFQRVDTCAAEFEALTPYFYSTYGGFEEAAASVSNRKKIMVLGGGPNRIGQGIEFDYCCVHAALALRKEGIECIMVNSNPETVSTDFDISDRLYFEPLTPEHILNIARVEKPEGVIVQFGGQTPLKIAKALEEAGLKVLGTSTQSIDWAEDREQCEKIVRDMATLGLKQPEATTARTRVEAIERAQELGYPVLVRPSFVLGGRGMRIVHSEGQLLEWIDEAIELSEDHPILIDRFLNRAIEVDVDAICDGESTLIGGVLEHIEEAGIHSGDSTSTLPPATLPESVVERIRTYTRELAARFQVRGLVNVQYAVQGLDIYLVEINPRASRTVPFVSKATGHPLAKIAVRVMLGETLESMGYTQDFDRGLDTFNVKAPVFPFDKFPGVDVLLGPEMKSTGEVMGRSHDFPNAFAKAMLGAGVKIPTTGNAFLSIRDEDKAEMISIAEGLIDLGFTLHATSGTASFLQKYGIEIQRINKFHEGPPHCIDAIKGGLFDLVINTVSDEIAISDSFSIRRAALDRRVPYSTVTAHARALVRAIRTLKRHGGASPLPISGRNS